jgi:YVTN family beta-propeller protein
MPSSAVLDSAKRWLYVANAGSDSVTIVDLTTGLSVGSVQTGYNPRGVLLSRDSGTLYVHNMIEGTITVYDNRTSTTNDVIPLSDVAIPADIQLGALIFHTANERLSADGWISCASCHFDGQSDGRVWRGFEDGWRNSPVIYNLADRAPYNALGNWDELADVEHKIRWLQAGAGLIEDGDPNPPVSDPNAGRSLDLDNLTAYLFSLQGPSAPPITDPELVARGAEVFQSSNCMSCHNGDNGTDTQRHDVGTGDEFITPTLRWLWMSAPYLHDGRATTLHDLFIIPGAHQLVRDTSLEDISALEAYLLSLP